MKTLQSLSLRKRKQIATKKSGYTELHRRYYDLIKFDLHEPKAHMKRWYSRRVLNDKEPRLRELLELFGFKYSTGNDAPRGGVEGDYVQMSRRAFETLKSLVD